MNQTLEAIFKDGSFKPVENGSLPFAEGQRVRLTVETPPRESEDLVKLAAHVFDGLAADEIDEVERIALDRSKFFPNRSTS